MKTVQFSLNNIDKVVECFLNDIQTVSVIAFVGDLGAGKTTFIREILAYWCFKGLVQSPTFAYLNVYSLDNGKVVYHFDLYRLKNLLEFETMGFSEYLYQPNSIVLIEWPEIIKDIIDKDSCFVELAILGQGERKLKYSVKR